MLRWQRARVSALQSVTGILGATSVRNDDSKENLATLEVNLLSNVPEELQDQVIRKVFDNSRKFGLSVSRYLNLSLEISDFSEILPFTGIPCFLGIWRRHNDAQILARKGCSLLSSHKSFGCDYWREALDGLVIGAGDTERLARHRSVGHGDDECVDVLFNESYARPRVVSADSQKPDSSSNFKKYGPVPFQLNQTLEDIAKRFESMRVKLYIDGFSEGTLYYRLETDEGVLCGAGGKLLHDSFCKELIKKFPEILAKDSSPLAVYGGST